MALARPPAEEHGPTYRALYGLRDEPFSTAPNNAYAFANDSMIAALNDCRRVVNDRIGLVVIDGEIGLGKTTLAHTLYADFKAKGLSVCSLPGVPGGSRQTEAGLLGLVVQTLGLTASHGRSVDGSLAAISKLGLQEVERSGTVVVMIDDAHELKKNGVRAVLKLLNLVTVADQLVQIVLLGQSPEMMTVIESDRALHSRLSNRATLSPLVEDDVRGLIIHRLRIAGRATRLFTDDAVAALTSLSGGIPRLICRIAHLSCQEAARAGASLVDADYVTRAGGRLGRRT